MKRQNKGRKSTIYCRFHRRAKIIMFTVQATLTLVVVTVLMDGSLVYLLPLVLIKELFYYFGTNTVAYVLEALAHYKHRHTII